MRTFARFCELDEVLTLGAMGNGQTAPVHRTFAVGTWLLATTVAAGLAWTAVDQVAARVTDRALASGPPAPRVVVRPATGETPETIAPETPTGTALPVPPASPPPSGNLQPPSSSPNAPRTSGGSIGPGSNPTTVPPATVSPPTPTGTGPAPISGQATVFVNGGSVTATCGAGSPRLVSAVPTNGYTTSVSSGVQLVVNFTSRTHRSIVEAECDGARVQFSTGEESAG